MTLPLETLKARAAADRIEGVRFSVVPKLRHFPMSENPSLFLEYLRPVLEETRGARSAAF